MTRRPARSRRSAAPEEASYEPDVMKPIKLTDAQMDAALGLGSGQVDNIQHVTGFSDDELAAVYAVPVDVVRAIRRMTHEHCKTGRCGELTHTEKVVQRALK